MAAESDKMHPVEQCPICDDEMVGPTKIGACTHRFCFECIRQALERDRRCPMCRVSVNSLVVDKAMLLVLPFFSDIPSRATSPRLAARAPRQMDAVDSEDDVGIVIAEESVGERPVSPDLQARLDQLRAPNDAPAQPSVAAQLRPVAYASRSAQHFQAAFPERRMSFWQTIWFNCIRCFPALFPQRTRQFWQAGFIVWKRDFCTYFGGLCSFLAPMHPAIATFAVALLLLAVSVALLITMVAFFVMKTHLGSIQAAYHFFALVICYQYRHVAHSFHWLIYHVVICLLLLASFTLSRLGPPTGIIFIDVGITLFLCPIVMDVLCVLLIFNKRHNGESMAFMDIH